MGTAQLYFIFVMFAANFFHPEGRHDNYPQISTIGKCDKRMECFHKPHLNFVVSKFLSVCVLFLGDRSNIFITRNNLVMN